MRVAGVPSDSPNGDSRRRFAREDGKKGVHGDDDATADLFAAAAPPSRGPSISAGVPVETEPELRDATPEQAFGQLLAENVLTNLDVRAVPLDTISNRVAVTTDAETGARLISHINAYLGENHVQNLGEQPLPEPIGPTEAFYSLNQHPVERYVSTKSGSAPPTAEWRMNVRAPQARQLIREMDDIARANSATLAWSVNDAKVAGVDPVPEVVSQLSTNSLSMNDTPASLDRSVVGERVEEQGVAGEASETEVLARKDGAAAGCEKGKAARSTLRRARGSVVGGRDPAKGDLPEDRDPADTQPASDSTLAGGRGGARGRCSGMFGDAIQESDADAWVVLAVSLRSIPASSSTMTTSPTPVDPVEVRRQRPTATSPATSQSTRRPTSQPTQQPTARATTQGAAGG